MKEASVYLKQLAVDGLTFTVATTLAFGGLWGLSSLGASLFTLSLFAVLMMPAIISTAVFFGRDIKDATHILIA
jgi:hypothetical protein